MQCTYFTISFLFSGDSRFYVSWSVLNTVLVSMNMLEAGFENITQSRGGEEEWDLYGPFIILSIERLDSTRLDST
jgi:hypothetical protein